MTNEERQQAIEWLKRRPVMIAGAKRMYDLAVEALEAYVPDMNVGDMISRQAAIEAIHEDAEWLAAQGSDWQVERMERDKSILKSLPAAQPKRGKWIPVSERLPKCEQEVLICTEVKLFGKDVYIDSIITPAFYEDGTMTENDSAWTWEDVDWAGWDEEDDCGIIPEGWWENRHFNPDGVLNCPVDSKVVAWMPLPEPYRKEP